MKFVSLAERALEYAQSFIAVAFFAIFVMEMKAERRVDWIQYLLVGLALAVFYLVLIGTAEHIGFEGGYLAAAAATALPCVPPAADRRRSPTRSAARR